MSPELADKAHALMCEIVGAWNTGGIVTHEVRGAVRQWLIDVADYEQRTSHEPPEEPSVMGGMLSQPRPPVPSGVKLIEWCVQQIQITCDALNLDPAQWLNDSTAQGDSAQPPAVPHCCGCDLGLELNRAGTHHVAWSGEDIATCDRATSTKGADAT